MIDSKSGTVRSRLAEAADLIAEHDPSDSYGIVLAMREADNSLAQAAQLSLLVQAQQEALQSARNALMIYQNPSIVQEGTPEEGYKPIDIPGRYNKLDFSRFARHTLEHMDNTVYLAWYNPPIGVLVQ